MKLLVSILLFTIISSASFAQFGYKNKLEPVNGVQISYKIVHEKFSDKSSPAQIRIKLKNTNDFDVNIKFGIEYTIGLTKRYNSGSVETCIPQKSTQAGKISGLVFELKTHDVEIFKSENAEWEFTHFEVEQVDDCKVLINK